MSSSWPQPTRTDHERFVRNEGWQQASSTDHETYELELPDGTVLRTRISRPPDRTTYGPRIWAHILRDQLEVTAEEFWACVQGGAAPERAPEVAPGDDDVAIPVDVVNLLVVRVGMTRRDLSRMTRQEAIDRLNEYWATGRTQRAVAGDLPLEELATEGRDVANAELSVRISETANRMSFADRLAAEGVTTAVIDTEGQLVERRPDGSTTVL